MEFAKRARLFAPLLLFAAVCAFCAAAGAFGVCAEEGIAADITETGIEFISSVPEEARAYRAGEGTLAYIPASDGETAKIVFENAEIYADTEVNYWSENRTYTAVAAKGDVEIELKGESKIYMRPSGSNTALLFYDGNVTVTGGGSLTVEYRSEGQANLDAHPVEVMGDYDVGPNGEAFAQSGNFELKSGALFLNGVGAVGQGCLTVSNRIEVSGGLLQTYGQTAGVYSVYGDIEFVGGSVRAENFNEYGLYARRGNVTIGGSAEVYVSCFARSSAIGICGGDMGSGAPETQSGGNVYLQGGKTEINVPYMGVFAQGTADAPSGLIEISGGTLDATVSQSTRNVASALCAQGESADIIVRGGTLNAVSGGRCGQASLGLYADRYLKIEGGSVRTSAENENDAGVAIGAYAEGSVSVTGGAFVSCGSTMAVGRAAPVFGQGIDAVAAADMAGENTIVYAAADYESYQYLKSEKREVLSVTVSPASAEAERGKTLQFHAEVKGTGFYDEGVRWSVVGANGEDTKIDENGLLTVAADETAATIAVTAVSASDPAKSASASVTVVSGGGSGGPNESGEENFGEGIPVGAVAAVVAGAAAGAGVIVAGVYLIFRKVKK